MKIAISSRGENLQAEVDARFGRAYGFIIYDLETGEFKFLDNSANVSAAQGAGVQAAQSVLNEGVKAVISGPVGPNVATVLGNAGIDCYIKTNGKVEEAISDFKNNKLEKADLSTGGRRGMGMGMGAGRGRNF
jgi:predicted Fe-Mo cluster-binding NifX family protein